jgi:spermidine synthase
VDAEPLDDRPRVIDRRTTARGELILRQAGSHYEVIAGGVFLMDTRDGRSERAMVRAATAGRRDLRLLLGGLGVGFSLDEALRGRAVREVVVVEIEPAVVDWSRTHLCDLAGHRLADPRVRLVIADLLDHLERDHGCYDAICLDTDNGPGWLVHPANAGLYDDRGLALLHARLNPGGRLAVWAAADDPGFERRLRARFSAVSVERVAVPRGPDDVVYVAEARPRTTDSRRAGAGRRGSHTRAPSSRRTCARSA